MGQSSGEGCSFTALRTKRSPGAVIGSPIPSTTEIQSAIEEEHVSISSENAERL
jgi:hypothetical protein